MKKLKQKTVFALVHVIFGIALLAWASISYSSGRQTFGNIWILCGLGFLFLGLKRLFWRK